VGPFLCSQGRGNREKDDGIMIDMIYPNFNFEVH